MLAVLIMAAAAFIYWFMLLFVGTADGFKHIWLLLSLALFLLYLLTKQYLKYPKRIPLSLIVSLHVCLALGILVFVITGALIFMHVNKQVEPHLDYVLVLGSKLDKKELAGKTLIARLDKAKEYLDANESAVLVLSGGVSAGQSISEAEVMAAYLMNIGVPAERLLLEIQSRNTRENILYSQALIMKETRDRRRENPLKKNIIQGRVLYAEERPQRIGIITSDFHTYRSMLLAQKADLGEFYMLSADSDPRNMLNMYLRECLAILKEKFMGYIS